MKIIILGAGQVGRTAAYHLAREAANEVTVVDINDELLRDLQDRLDIRTLVGSGTQPSVLEAAGARDADIFIALTNSDEVNMVACQISWSLFNKDATRIARIRSADFTKHTKLFSNEDRAFAVDVPISPEQLVTEHVVHLMAGPTSSGLTNEQVVFVRATGLRPFLEPLPDAQRVAFLLQYEERIAEAYPARADGKRLLAFPRLFIVAQRKA